MPCASLHKDEVKINASEEAEVITPAPTHKWMTKRVMNVAAPAVVSNSYQFEIDPNAAPTLTHFLGTSQSAQLYTSHELGADQVPALTHLLGTSKSAQSLTLCTLTPVTNSLP